MEEGGWGWRLRPSARTDQGENSVQTVFWVWCCEAGDDLMGNKLVTD